MSRKNIWFLRTDKDEWDAFDVTAQNPFIYSMHGVCGDKSYATEHKDKIFPTLDLAKHELYRLVASIKKRLVKAGKLDPNGDGKKRCDLVLWYWLGIMKEGDFVFVRNKKDQVLICKVTGYISESFFDKHGFFQRPVEILGQLKNDPKYQRLWNRTYARKTLERNANSEVRELVWTFLRSLNP